MLRVDALTFEELLRQKGSVKTRLDFYTGVPHAFNVAFLELKIGNKFVTSGIQGFR
jgi:hypothetical protein